MTAPRQAVERIVGRYALYGEIASGGMATVHYGRLLGPVGFSRTVAIKRLHAQFAKDPEFVSMFLDEARLAGRIHHPNAVVTLDVVALEGELFLVMEYVLGETLSRLMRNHRQRQIPIPTRLVASVMSGMLHGLHAAHEATTERGEPLGIVHRDVSPQNVMVGTDGVARVLDFGVAKAKGRLQSTREGQIKGKLPYMPPEQITGRPVDRRLDVYAASVVLWEALTGRALFAADNEGAMLALVMGGATEPPSRYRPDLPRAVDELVMRGLAYDPNDRPATARELAIAIEEVVGMASPRQVGDWVEGVAGASLAKRAERIEGIESISTDIDAHRAPMAEAPPPAAPPAAPEPGPSQVSSVSMSTGQVPMQRSPVPMISAIVASLAVGGLVAVVLTQRGAPAAPAPVVATPVVAAAPPMVAAAPGVAATPATVAAIAVTAAPSAVVSAPASASAAPARPPPVGRRPAAAAPAEAPKASCNPPYFIDPSGIRRAKPECL